MHERADSNNAGYSKTKKDICGLLWIIRVDLASLWVNKFTSFLALYNWHHEHYDAGYQQTNTEDHENFCH